MASSEALVSLYLATIDSDPQEAEANMKELSRRIAFAFKANIRCSSTGIEVTRVCEDTRRIFDS